MAAESVIEAAGGSEKMAKQEAATVAKMDVKQVRRRIQALHIAYDDIIPGLKTAAHRKEYKEAMQSETVARKHLLNMYRIIRAHMSGAKGGLHVGVVIPVQEYLSKIMGKGGGGCGGGGCGCGGGKSRGPGEGKEHPGDVLYDKHGQDSFGRTYQSANHYRSSGIERGVGVKGYEAHTEPILYRGREVPAYPKENIPNLTADARRFLTNRRVKGLDKSIRIRS